MFPTRLDATHAGIRTPGPSTAACRARLPRGRDAPLPFALSESAASVPDLAPLHCRRRSTRPVSYYALFQGWLLLSQPPGCLRAPTSLPTQSGLRDLSWRSGLFPFRRRSLAPAVSLLPVGPRALVVWLGLVSASPLAHPAPYLPWPPRRLSLKTFRGEPAISGFDWHFTSIHSSSPSFATLVGSDLHTALPALHPGHG